MKTKKFLKGLFFLLFIVATGIISCSQDIPEKEQKKIVYLDSQSVEKNDDFLLVYNVDGTVGAQSSIMGRMPEFCENISRSQLAEPPVFEERPVYKDLFFLDNPTNLPANSARSSEEPLVNNNDFNFRAAESPVTIGSSRLFNAYKMSGEVFSLQATCQYIGAKCNIFVQNNKAEAWNSEPVNVWEKVGKFFDEKIYGKDLNAFGEPTDFDGNEKINILYFDMPDSTGVIGFFFAVDLYQRSESSKNPQIAYSNEMEIFYMNLNWNNGNHGDAGLLWNNGLGPMHEEMKRTLAHEFQHMINYGQRVMKNKRVRMDTWLDEGLAESAEQICLGTPGESRIKYFNNDAAHLIRNGHSLVTWSRSSTVMANYAQSYLFATYLRAQKEDVVCKQLINQIPGDYRAVENVMDHQPIESIFRNFRLANLYQEESGIYSYKNKLDYNDFDLPTKHQLKVYSPSKVQSFLDPGAALYLKGVKNLDAFSPEENSSKVKFYRQQKNSQRENWSNGSWN